MHAGERQVAGYAFEGVGLRLCGCQIACGECSADVGHVGVVEEQFGQFQVQRFVAFEAVDDVLVIYFAFCNAAMSFSSIVPPWVSDGFVLGSIIRAMTNRNQQYHDPFEPGVSSPEFEQFARQSYASHGGRGAARPSAPGAARPGTPGGPGPASAPGAPAGYGAGRGAGRNGAPAGYGGQPGNTPYSRWSRGGSGTTRMPGGSAAAGAHAGNSAQPAYARHGRHGAVRPQQGWASPSETCDMGFAGSAGAYVSPLKRFAGLVVCVLIAVLIEVFGFNLAFFTSMTYPQVGTYLVNGVAAGTEGALTLDASANYFEITGLDDTVRSIHFTPQLNDPAAAAKATDSKLQVVMYLQDEGNANYYQLPAVSVDPKDAASTYISLDPAGDCHSIYVSITNLADVGSVTVTGIGLNQQVPFDIDPLRFAYILAVLLALYAVRPQSAACSTAALRARAGWSSRWWRCSASSSSSWSCPTRTSCPLRTLPARRTSSSTKSSPRRCFRGTSI